MKAESSEGDQGIAAWAAVLRCHAAAVPLISEEVQAKTGLPLSWYDVLLELRAAENGRLRMQDLGARVVLSRSRVSRIVEEMADARLVDRQQDPDDRRGVLARITSRGERQLRKATPVYLDAIDRLFAAHMTRREQTVVATALSRVTSRLDSGSATERH
jgi:DNA-binding MarR family transcriptional regulator